MVRNAKRVLDEHPLYLGTNQFILFINTLTKAAYVAYGWT